MVAGRGSATRAPPTEAGAAPGLSLCRAVGARRAVRPAGLTACADRAVSPDSRNALSACTERLTACADRAYAACTDSERLTARVLAAHAGLNTQLTQRGRQRIHSLKRTASSPLSLAAPPHDTYLLDHAADVGQSESDDSDSEAETRI